MGLELLWSMVAQPQGPRAPSTRFGPEDGKERSLGPEAKLRIFLRLDAHTLPLTRGNMGLELLWSMVAQPQGPRAPSTRFGPEDGKERSLGPEAKLRIFLRLCRAGALWG
ncbi:hypothetical protein GW7_06855 [Heterocephalus glaber]|uniref:Uncharacterized protein n=1 Tax=Heterocephalus glaber TaxID=10181 RepID=G5B0K2_HETGA|nr:hypothetical protein GW7_06855 [Heterocephalus glaber]